MASGGGGSGGTKFLIIHHQREKVCRVQSTVTTVTLLHEILVGNELLYYIY